MSNQKAKTMCFWHSHLSVFFNVLFFATVSLGYIITIPAGLHWLTAGISVTLFINIIVATQTMFRIKIDNEKIVMRGVFKRKTIYFNQIQEVWVYHIGNLNMSRIVISDDEERVYPKSMLRGNDCIWFEESGKRIERMREIWQHEINAVGNVGGFGSGSQKAIKESYYDPRMYVKRKHGKYAGKISFLTNVPNTTLAAGLGAIFLMGLLILIPCLILLTDLSMAMQVFIFASTTLLGIFFMLLAGIAYNRIIISDDKIESKRILGKNKSIHKNDIKEVWVYVKDAKSIESEVPENGGYILISDKENNPKTKKFTKNSNGIKLNLTIEHQKSKLKAIRGLWKGKILAYSKDGIVQKPQQRDNNAGSR